MAHYRDDDDVMNDDLGDYAQTSGAAEQLQTMV